MHEQCKEFNISSIYNTLTDHIASVETVCLTSISLLSDLNSLLYNILTTSQIVLVFNRTKDQNKFGSLGITIQYSPLRCKFGITLQM